MRPKLITTTTNQKFASIPTGRRTGFRFAVLWLAIAIGLLWCCDQGSAQEIVQPFQESESYSESGTTELDESADWTDIDRWVSPDRFSGTIRTVLLLAVLSLAPAVLMMTTSFIRIIVVLGILRQALGFQQLPSTQIITALALFMTLLIMAPVWSEVKNEAIIPYTSGEDRITLEQAWERGSRPVKSFMSRQIDLANNVNDIWLFYKYLPEEQRQEKPETFDDIPIQVLLPAFMISELKIAFLIGFQIFMPFVVIDLIVTSVTTSMGMIMLPPAMVSLPLKLLLFVLTDGWNLIVGMLMQSFVPYA